MPNKLIEVSAPYVLPRRNFYIQPPFTEEFPKVEKDLDLDETTLKVKTSKIAKSMFHSWLISPKDKIVFPNDPSLEEILSQEGRIDQAINLDFKEKLRSLVGALMRYDKLMFYIATQMDSGVFNNDGELSDAFKKETPGFEAVDTYAWWITKRFNRLARRSVGLIAVL
jgi:hypothetical protein